MRKRLMKLTAVLLIGGASSVALAMPASAATVTAVVAKAVVSPSLRMSDTGTSTNTGTPASFLATSVITAVFVAQPLATVVG